MGRERDCDATRPRIEEEGWTRRTKMDGGWGSAVVPLNRTNLSPRVPKRRSATFWTVVEGSRVS